MPTGTAHRHARDRWFTVDDRKDALSKGFQFVQDGRAAIMPRIPTSAFESGSTSRSASRK